MTLGTILADLGLSVAAATIVYLKRMEEKELADRFGEAYLAYRRDVPFIIPRIPRKG
jgi:protein-S-isoprenylcysteine O-methyltransferase Ste14